MDEVLRAKRQQNAASSRAITIRGAREHNLKNIDVEIPRDRLVVFTGLSGSGKSSLAFDTIYAEGQRRYVESLSAYARQFLEMMQKPDVDQIDGIGLLTGQVGYAWNNVLWYVKGGAAVTDNKYSTNFTATGVVYNQASDTRWGGAVGTGIELGFAPNWSVAVEYDHLFMGNRNVTFPASAIAVTRSDNIRQGVDMGTVRVNYRFGGPVIAKY